MHAALDLALENTRARRFVQAGDLQDMGGIDPVVTAAPHDTVGTELELVHRNLVAITAQVNSLGGVKQTRTNKDGVYTLL